tara:strand:- start:3051 stop:5318 length:2268 start_codon:yes stop_codon:yes gene_type:complete
MAVKIKIKLKDKEVNNMNVLQRRMFQEGGPSDKLIQIKPVNSELIRYYVQQGYSPLEIQEVYPAANLGIIEKIAREEGGSLNPAVSLGESFTGSPVVTPEQRSNIIPESISTPLGNLSFERSAEPELPRMEDVSVVPKGVRDYITNAGSVLDRANLIRGLGVSFNMSEAEASSAIDMVTGSIVPEMSGVDAPELPGLEDVMTGEQAQVATSTLGPNQYRASNGKVYEIDPNKFLDQLNIEDSRIIGGLLMNPNVEYGSNLASIVEGAATRRSSTLVPEENIRVGQGIQGLNAAEILQSGAKLGVDTAKEGIESLYNIARAPFTNPTIAGIFGSRDRARELRKSGAGDRVNLFETGLDDVNLNNPFRAAQTLVTGGLDEYFKTGGEKPETLDTIVRESSIGEVATPIEDEIGKDLQNLENQQEADKATAEAAGSEVVNAEKVGAEEVITENAEDLDEGEKGDKSEEQQKSDATPSVVSAASSPEQVGSVFNNQNFIRYVANLSKGLAKAGSLGEGIALGSALAAEERGLRDLEKQSLDQEVLLKEIESGKMDFKDRKDIYETEAKMATSILDYNNAVAAQELATSVIDFANGDKNLASFASKIGATLDDVKSAAGIKDLTKVSQLSNTKRAQIALTILTNRNIKEILGESGRTISNIDRDIAKRVVGSLEILKLDNIATLKATLQDNIRSIVEKRNEAQRNIDASVRFLAPYDPNILKRDSELFQIFQKELGVAPQGDFSPANPAFNIDMTGEFNQ